MSQPTPDTTVAAAAAAASDLSHDLNRCCSELTSAIAKAEALRALLHAAPASSSDSVTSSNSGAGAIPLTAKHTHSVETNPGSLATADASDDRRHLMHEKSFKPRESVLTHMLQSDESYRSIYHAAIAALAWLFLRLIISEYKDTGAIVKFDTLSWAFGRADVVMTTWIVLFAVSLGFPLLAMQTLRSAKHLSSPTRLKQLSFLYAIAQVFLYVYAIHNALKAKLPPASGLIIMCECARLSMKMHAYLREKVVHGMRHTYLENCRKEKLGAGGLVPTGSGFYDADAIFESLPPFQQKLHRFADYLPREAAKHGVDLAGLRANQPEITIGGVNQEMGRLIYFMYCPTLVYRDHYPRLAAQINWVSASIQLLNVLLVVMFTYVLIRGSIVPSVRANLPSDPLEIALLISSVMAPTFIAFLLCFFGILHSWLNLFAELLQFADRRFYTKWWESTSWSSYYRRWNMVVGDFLHSYVYNDVQRSGVLGKAGAEGIVFVFSAIIHELILATAFRFWMPALLLMFGGPGVFFVRLTRRLAPRLGNVFLWAMLSIGLAILCVMYARELYSRHGHEWPGSAPKDQELQKLLYPQPSWGWSDYASYVLMPRSWVEWMYTHHSPSHK